MYKWMDGLFLKLGSLHVDTEFIPLLTDHRGGIASLSRVSENRTRPCRPWTSVNFMQYRL